MSVSPFSQKGSHVVVYGAGGHGRVVADAALAAGYELLGFLDDRLPVGHELLDRRVLGKADWLTGRSSVAVALGIGDNAARARLADGLGRGGASLATVVHPSAVVSSHVQLGEGTVVFALAILNVGARVGRGAIINSGAIVEHDVVVGDFAHVASNATLAGAAHLGGLALLGTGATVLPGRIIGERCVVGAGAVVSRDVPADGVAVGVPARLVTTRATPPRALESDER